MHTFTLNLDPIVHLTDEQFYQLCQANRDLNFEGAVKKRTRLTLLVFPMLGTVCDLLFLFRAIFVQDPNANYVWTGK